MYCELIQTRIHPQKTKTKHLKRINSNTNIDFMFVDTAQILSEHGAKAICVSNPQEEEEESDCNVDFSPPSTSVPIPAPAPTPRVVGIEIKKWRITSVSTSSIANESEVDQMTKDLQTSCMPLKEDGSCFVPASSITNASNSSACSKLMLIHPPEILFLGNNLKLEYGDFVLSFCPRDALMEWGKAHRGLNSLANECPSVSSKSSLSILKSADAKLWSKNVLADSETKQIIVHHDWTFSSIYDGSVSACPNDGESHQTRWESLQDSGISGCTKMLMDKSAPILMYDDVPLYEDDLHDNGESQLSVKVRIMPKCFYILLRFFLRIDNVLVRCRDVRFFHLFEMKVIYRDITWREATWDTLKILRLPTSPSFWNSDKCAGYLDKLPFVQLPEGVRAFSSMRI